MKTIHITFNDKHYEVLKMLAEYKGFTKPTSLIRYLINDYIYKNKKNIIKLKKIKKMELEDLNSLFLEFEYNESNTKKYEDILKMCNLQEKETTPKKVDKNKYKIYKELETILFSEDIEDEE